MIEGLITNRTKADVSRAEYLSKIPFSQMTEAEKSEWLSGLFGAYNATDLNRVESTVTTLATILSALPEGLKEYAEEYGVAWNALFDVPYIPEDYSEMQTKTDWSKTMLPQIAEMTRYLDNVEKLKEAFDTATVDLPESMDDLGYEEANNIERVLLDVEASITDFVYKIQTYIENTAATFLYSGEIYCGEV